MSSMSELNDVMALFVDGENCALLPGTQTPLTCTVPVQRQEPVDVRIAAADASDSAYDSAIALLDGGIWSE